jgi:hypothetical protein
MRVRELFVKVTHDEPGCTLHFAHTAWRVFAQAARKFHEAAIVQRVYLANVEALRLADFENARAEGVMVLCLLARLARYVVLHRNRACCCQELGQSVLWRRHGY